MLHAHTHMQKFQHGQTLESVTAADRKLSQESNDAGTWKYIDRSVGDLPDKSISKKVNVTPACSNVVIAGGHRYLFLILRSFMEN